MKLFHVTMILAGCFAGVCLITAELQKQPKPFFKASVSADLEITDPSSLLSGRSAAETTTAETLKEVYENIIAASRCVRDQHEQTVQKVKNKPAQPLFALVIDDMGFNYKMAEKINDMGITATWAVIPGTPYCHEVAALAEKSGQPFILHVPMQALIDSPGSGYAVGTDTSEEAIRKYISELKNKYPHAIGINNHRGSKATSDRQTMLRFMRILASTGWSFLDSRTFGKTIAHKVAEEYHIPVVQNGAFIDGSPDLETMKVQFFKAVKHAQKYGSVVAICHAREKTLAFLNYLAQIHDSPVTFVTLDQLWKKSTGHYQKEDK